MKKTAAILFLFVFLFNLYGYRLLIDCLQTEKETTLLAQLDNEAYALEDLVTIKTPVALPYYTNSATYDRIDGTIEIEGEEYRYVKRRIYNDSLELLCIPNKAKQQLQTAADNFFKLTTEGVPAHGKEQTAKGFKNVLLEYCNALADYNFQPFYIPVRSLPGLTGLYLPATNTLLQDKPPEAA